MLAASPLLSKCLLCRCPFPAVILLLDQMQNPGSLVLDTAHRRELPQFADVIGWGFEEGPASIALLLS